MKLARHQNWPLHLKAFLIARMATPFAWGVQDCALFAADAVKAQCIGAPDLAAEFRGTYTDKAGAQAILDALGMADMVAVADARLGGAHPAPTYARRGDIVVVESPYGPSLAVVGLDGLSAFSVAENGLARVPMAGWIKGWAV
jgi:hypothetical protein